MEKFKVIFYPSKKEIETEKGKSILACVISAGLYLHSSCGGEGVCGRCKVILKKGKVTSQPTGKLSLEEKQKGYYLACLTTVESVLEIEIPPESTLNLEKISPEEQYTSRLKGIYEAPESIEEKEYFFSPVFLHSPLATKLYLELPQPNLDDKISDLERLYRQIRRIGDFPIMQTGLANIRKLGLLFRQADWKITVTLGKRNGTVEIVLIEPGDTSQRNYGLAFDIGTTTISGQLINLNTKEILSTKVTYNRQANFGSDIISRIIYAEKETGLDKLHHAVIDSMNEMIFEMTSENSVDLNDVTCLLCAGNTTMIHLLLKVDPLYLRRSPYVPTANFIPVVRASEAGIKINPRGLLACVPGVSSYVGGDIISGVLACQMHKTKDLTLLVDIGTNGEVVLGNRDWLICCSASAGPAFEGSGVNCGMRASKGAIQKLKINEDFSVEYQTIANLKPRGICGSAYIDTLAELLSNHFIDRRGRFEREVPCKRIRESEYEREFILAYKEETDIDQDIVINEADIENLKRAKAAIFAAISTLIKHMNLGFEDVKKVFVAGGFGAYLNIQKAISIGLLPDLPVEKFLFVGNSSLTGARQILLSYDAYAASKEIASQMTYFELSTDSKYFDEYASALFFPHTDESRFPNIRF